ncbi:MAG: ATP-binding cassette domain-containing protein [Opitutales bacterium]|nr:ATP-binding cassette domain-containing protein [Opitutales bacterium]
MSLISLSEVSLRYGEHVLLDKADLHVAEGDRLAIVGRNGCGKTSLLKIVCGLENPDGGLVERVRGLKSAYLPQEVPQDLSGTVFDAAAEGLGQPGKKISRYRRISELGEAEERAGELDGLVAWLSESGGFAAEQKICEVLDKLELAPDMDVATLSAGLKRRVLLARGLVSDPDVLILDEPTNHLDIDSVIWLEKFLKSCGKTLVFVSHDRSFLQNLATRVAEVDRGSLISFDCGYSEFIRRRDELLEAQERNNAVFDKHLAQEEAWLRKGVKARRTRNEGRVRELMKLREIRRARRTRQGVLSLGAQEALKSGRKVLDAEGLGVSFGGRKIVGNFSTTIFSGDKIGIIGRNGVGKTTLLNALLGRLKPDSGTVKYGTNLQIAYFDQLRSELNPKMTPYDFVGGGADFVSINSRRQNVAGYLQSFMFSPAQMRGEIAMLSGGERNRLLLAKLFASPANFFVLDEPTNDLDTETIEVLESFLVSFKGTVLLVSHDRTFLNNIVSGVFGFLENGEIAEIVGGYDEWFEYQTRLLAAKRKTSEPPKAKPAQPQKREKFTNKEREEFAQIPDKIEALDAERGDIGAKFQDPEFLRNNADKIKSLEARLEEIRLEEERLFERWSELEQKRQRCS